MVNRKCCVPNCGKKQSDNIILHQFPNPVKEPDRFRSWLYAIGGDILGMRNDDIFKKCSVCHYHFESKYYTASKRLSAIAVPTLQLTEFKTVKLNRLGDITNYQQQPSTSTESMETAQPSCSNSSTQQTSTLNIDEVDSEMQSKAQPKPNVKNQKRRFVFSSEAVNMSCQIKKLQAAKDKIATRLKKALKLSENITFQKAIKNFTAAALVFILLQFREISKNKMGRRFTRKEKIMALSLYKQGPRAYRWLRHIFVLPAPVTLSRIISRANLRAGLNDNIFEQLKKRASKMTATDKLCILLFDEMALAPHFEYNRKRDKIIGFVDDGKNVTMKIADHALVFMIRGVTRNYKQPVAYTFCAGSTSKVSLAIQIKEIIKKLMSVGFTVLATVCDQGASNKSAINHLIQETRDKYARLNQEYKRNTFEIEDEEIIPLYDPPHLIKGIRNNMLNKNLVCEIDGKKKIAKWDHIMQLYSHNPAYKGIRLLPKLTEQHVNPRRISKMKVKCATQVFSKSLGTTMGFLAENKILSEECTETADVILFFDELFDSVNGSYKNNQRRSGKPLLGALTPSSCHEKLWTSSKTILRTMKFVNNVDKLCTVPSVTNWLWTIENIEYLKLKIFQQYQVRSIWLRHFNQDPLENFFGSIRSHGVRNINPTCAAFETAFAALLINNLSNEHSIGSNCEKDSCRMFLSLKKIFFSKTEIAHGTTEIDSDHILNNNIIVGIETKKSSAKIIASLEYVTGYVLKKHSKMCSNCTECKACLYDESESSQYIQLKDFARSARRDNSGSKSFLAYPSNNLVEYFSGMQDVIIYTLRTHSMMNNIKDYIKTLIDIHCNDSFMICRKHKREFINIVQEHSCTFFLNNWCRNINNILKGLRFDVDNEDIMQKMAFEYTSKRRKIN